MFALTKVAYYDNICTVNLGYRAIYDRLQFKKSIGLCCKNNRLTGADAIVIYNMFSVRTCSLAVRSELYPFHLVKKDAADQCNNAEQYDYRVG